MNLIPQAVLSVRLGWMLVLISLLTGCASFMLGYKEDEYLNRWWPIDPADASVSPSGYELMELSMGHDTTIRQLVGANGYPDYIMIRPEDQTELAYVSENKLVKLQRFGLTADSDLPTFLPLEQATSDWLQFKPTSANLALARDKTPTPAPDTSVSRGYVNAPAPVRADAVNANYGSYFALIIANRDYKHWQRLKTPLADAQAVAKVLTQRYHFSVDVRENLNRYQLITALHDYRKRLNEGDNLLIYYAGHGNMDVETERGFWIPVDAEKDNPANWVSNEDITNAIKAMKARHVLVVADSCYSGTLSRAGETYSTERGTEVFAQRVNQHVSRTVLTSGGFEPVSDSGGAGLSVFARAFVDSLSANQRTIAMQSLSSDVKHRVALGAEQTPIYSDIRFAGHSKDGDFVFVAK